MTAGRHNARSFFDTYVFGFMCADIERELNLARSGQPAGNFLCALGLLCYTEFMGGLILRNDSSGGSRKRFNAFFDSLGPYYKQFRKTNNVYRVFRCGLAHEYFVSQECSIIMLSALKPIVVTGTGRGIGPSLYIPDVNVNPPFQGIGKASNGRYYFLVEQYYSDFRNACENLVVKLEKEPDGGLPPLSGITWWLKKS